MSNIAPALRDPTLTIPAWMYPMLCIPIRLAFGLALILHQEFTTTSPPTLLRTNLVYFAMFVIAGLVYKRTVNPHSWKSYVRTIAAYLIIIALLVRQGDAHMAISFTGLLVVVDALVGLESYHHHAISLAHQPQLQS